MDIVAMSSGLEAALARTGETVTAFIEKFAGEPIDADERYHTMTRAPTRNPLKVPDGHPLIKRTVVLRGRTSAKPYVYAESLLVPGRLPAVFFVRLETSADPIGRILTEEGITFTRSPLAPPDLRPPVVRGDSATAPNGCALARR